VNYVTVLKTALPKAPGVWLEALVAGASRWGIDTKDRLAAFAGQLGHESAEFTRFEENLNYGIERLMAVWPKRFPNRHSAAPYARNPQALANHVYGSRMGNGPEESGDGWLYRGRGPIQLTGMNNYRDAGAGIGVDLISAPDKVLEPETGIAAAGWFWTSRGLNDLADIQAHGAITKKINGGDLGLEHRTSLTNKIRSLM
jgi:putative chitinase